MIISNYNSLIDGYEDCQLPVIAWWSGGASSAVACRLAIEYFDNVKIVFIDTYNEDEDTYRFKEDCEKWYETPIETISNPKYKNIKEVWKKYLSLNTASGAICSSELKREMRIKYQKENPFLFQVFGFDIQEYNRAIAMKMNYPESKPIFPLIIEMLKKPKILQIIQKAAIELPNTYKYGFHNNNCFNTGCVQGGIGYWQKIAREFPDKFEEMAAMEHELTDAKGQPVTICKDQSKGGGLIFLKPHPNYPLMKDISMMKGREPESLIECNGFCGTYDLQTNPQ